MADSSAAPLRREFRFLIAALIVFLGALIVTLFSLAISILRMDRVGTTADAARDAVVALAVAGGRADLEARLRILRADHGITRVEVYRGDQLYAASGQPVDAAAEVITRPLPNGKMLFYFDASRQLGGRRNALIIGALATLATIAGLLILTLYLPRFVRPLEEMLAHAQQLGAQASGDHDARYLVDSFREAVERIQHQARELDHLRDAASSRTPDVRELARALNRSFTSGFLAVDATGAVVAVNEAGREILGIAAAAPAESITLDALAPSFTTIVRESLETRVALTRREVLLEATGALIGVTTVPLFEESAFLGMFALFTDLTSFRAMEGRLRDLENLVGLGQMSAGIAHEFRNSLFTILGYLQLAQRTAAEEPSAKIRSAEQEAQKLAAAVDALLNFARPLQIRSQRVRLDEIVSAVVDRFSAATPDVSFSFESAGPVELNGDRELLERAFENILRNAVDAVRQRHSDGGGSVATRIAIEPHPTITIRDNGVGVDQEHASAYLLPFQSGKPHGFGLGLPLARKIILHHGGTLALSGAPGEGASVQIDFFTQPVLQKVPVSRQPTGEPHEGIAHSDL